MDQPLLVTRPKKKDLKLGKSNIYLVPEICHLTGLTDVNRNNFSLMKELSRRTQPDPNTKAQKIMGFIKRIITNEQAKEELSKWSMSIEPDMLNIEGHLLNQEKLIMGGKEIMVGTDWRNDMLASRVNVPVHMRSWIFVFPRKLAHLASDVLSGMKRVAGPMGIGIDMPDMIELVDDRTESYINAMRVNIKHRQTQFVFCLLTSDRKDRYDAIKVFSCCDHSVLTQCVLANKASNKTKLLTICTGLVWQINVKLGGELWAMSLPKGLMGTMIIGIDVWHDPKRKRPSVCAVVATRNPSMSLMYSQFVFHEAGQEITSHLTTLITAARRCYYEDMGRLPERTIIFRDGVGDGQLEVVKQYELQQIWDCLKQEQPGQSPKVAFLVTKKRIKERFFAVPEAGGRGGGTLRNPPPGTVVDSEVTRPEASDFFLVSQLARHSTVTPTHYNILYTTLDWPASLYQRLSYKLCHSYFNWAGTVSVPAPCLYAHKLAYLAGESLHRNPNPDMARHLYYI